MARPQIPIDPDVVEKLAAIHCTMKEIAAVVECSVDTLERRFAEIIKQGRDKGKTSLKRWQWKAAEKGNVTMQIWLGKNYLGQSDGKMEAEAANQLAEKKQTPEEWLKEVQRKRAELEKANGHGDAKESRAAAPN